MRSAHEQARLRRKPDSATGQAVHTRWQKVQARSRVIEWGARVRSGWFCGSPSHAKLRTDETGSCTRMAIHRPRNRATLFQKAQFDSPMGDFCSFRVRSICHRERRVTGALVYDDEQDQLVRAHGQSCAARDGRPWPSLPGRRPNWIVATGEGVAWRWRNVRAQR